MSKKENTVNTEPVRQAPEVAESAVSNDAASTEQETEVSDTKYKLVIGAFPETEEKMNKLWSKMFDGSFKILTIEKGEDVRTSLTLLLADETVADKFVYVAPNVIPCSKVTFEELCSPVVYANTSGKRNYDFPLPRLFDKSALVDAFAGNEEKDDKVFIKEYMDAKCSRPVDVGFSFGNYVTPVLRANPCESVVLEALVRKKFISASPEGFAAITGLLDNTLLEK